MTPVSREKGFFSPKARIILQGFFILINLKSMVFLSINLAVSHFKIFLSTTKIILNNVI